MVRFGSTKQHRVNGALVSVRERKTRMVDFGDGPQRVALLTWGDIIAYRSTGIPNIEDYFVFDPASNGSWTRSIEPAPCFGLPRCEP